MISALEWRVCPNFPRFEVSECGDVRRGSTHCRIIGKIDADGYVRYSLRDKAGRRRSPGAHQLVMAAFGQPQPTEEHQIAHQDGSRLHNHFSNLIWATSQENHSHREVHGTAAQGERNGRAKITEADVHDIRIAYRAIKLGKSNRRIPDLARAYGLHHASLLRIAQGKNWKHVPMPHADVLTSQLDR
ncbi:HNH endonuclease [Asticcacaulis sp. AC466]|uniref:HNH endonuclease n=1 Tax=Asticcacaulis sp. AC466 TaxID=1282362 RepID=UPI0009E0B6C8|nr:HNH endonuclease [Asticcacaulis sp. AC466]